MTVGERQERRDGASKRVSGEPHFGVRIQLSDIVIQILRGVVIAILLPQCSNQTCRVAGVCCSLTVANLPPEVLATLTAATAEEQIVVDLVIRGRLGAVEHGRRGALQSYDDRRVLRIGEDVSTQTVCLPPKIFGVVEASIDIFPVPSPGLQYVGVRGHAREAEHRLSIGHIWPRQLVDGPVLGSQLHRLPSQSSVVKYAVDGVPVPVHHPLDAHDLRLGA